MGMHRSRGTVELRVIHASSITIMVFWFTGSQGLRAFMCDSCFKMILPIVIHTFGNFEGLEYDYVWTGPRNHPIPAKQTLTTPDSDKVSPRQHPIPTMYAPGTDLGMCAPGDDIGRYANMTHSDPQGRIRYGIPYRIPPVFTL